METMPVMTCHRRHGVRTITSRVLLVGTVALWFIQSGPRAEEKESRRR